MNEHNKTTPRDRLRALLGWSHPIGEPVVTEEQALAFRDAEVHLALQPRQVSPELAEALIWLDNVGQGMHGDGEGARADTIAAEMRRLRIALDGSRSSLKRKGEVLREALQRIAECRCQLWAMTGVRCQPPHLCVACIAEQALAAGLTLPAEALTP